MEEEPSTAVFQAEIVGIKFSLATHQEICTASISEYPINHVSQLANPFLGLPLQFGKCESCGTSEPGQCEGHFGYIELPVPIYHPGHVNELKRMLSLLCLKCLKLKKTKSKSNGLAERLLSSCCEGAAQISVEVRTTDGANYLELKIPARSTREGFWNFLERYGYRYGDDRSRTLLPFEVAEILRRIPGDTRRKLAAKGYFPQDGYILQYLPVPPNCLSVPDVSDGFSSMSSDPSRNELKDVLRKVESIKSSRSGVPNFESHKIEAIDLYKEVDKYLQVRGAAKATRNIDVRYGINKDSAESSTKAWLEKMRTLFIRKGSGFSSRTVITGDSYKRVNEIGVPSEIAQRITFEERVSVHNIKYLQDLVDNKLCLTYTDGASTYSLREGSKGHTCLRPGQVVHRRIMDGDIVFINRPPTTHKHSLQALYVYVHDDHTVKINPLICGPLSADFDGDCVHLFYPQSVAARAEVLELFSVDKQLLSSHNGQLNLQLASDSLLSLRVMFEKLFVDKAAAQQLAMFGSSSLPPPSLLKPCASGPCWSAMQILQNAFPEYFSCSEDKYLIRESDLLEFDFGDEAMQSVMNDMVASIFSVKGPKEVLGFFDSLQPLLMESLFMEGFSVSLEDLCMSKTDMRLIHETLRDISPSLSRLRSSLADELQLEKRIQLVKELAANFMLKSYSLRNLIDFRSESAINKLVQQIGFLGLQLSEKKKFYSKNLVEDMASFFHSKYPEACSSSEFGLVKSCFFHGLDPYEELAHSISTREVIVRSSRGLAEPGTLFKNLMAVLRDIVISYDGTVRNTCSNSVVQFKYEGKDNSRPQSLFCAGEPVGVLAATAMSNPAYKAVLDSTPSSNSSWEQMKETLLCKVIFNNDVVDRQVILYLNECSCPRKYCQENAACSVKNQLQKVSLKDTAVEFLIGYDKQQTLPGNLGLESHLVGHIHLDKMLLQELNISMQEVLHKCQETITLAGKKKKFGQHFKRTAVSVSECCSMEQSHAAKCADMPCLSFFSQDGGDIHVESASHILSNIIYPGLMDTVIRGDPRISSANIVWISPEMSTCMKKPSSVRKGEWALDVVVEKSAVKKTGDAWRVVMDSCLPVFHLIDTTRSIPYAIKQLQGLLGISCAFEQGVKRISTSVKMVSKGVLKEHLILLGNSMTCSGDLVGFNSGGYKALTRSLNVQAPFTDATLFTPRRCFERAAEKCHSDSLSSIVGSCSWGKRVAVGTGSGFDLLWDTKEAGFSKEEATDVYSFLHMVRSTNREDSYTGCLGVDIDDIVPEEEMVEWCASPEPDSTSGKPFFEDSAEFAHVLDEQPAGSKWEKASAWDSGSFGGSDWGTNKSKGGEPNLDNSNAWTSWKKQENGDAKNSLSWQTQDDDNPARSDGWDSAPRWGSKPKSSSQSAWNHGKDDSLGVASPETREEGGAGWKSTANWGAKSKPPDSSIWNSQKRDIQDVESNAGWASAAAWGAKANINDASTWNSQKRDIQDSESNAGWDSAATWGKKPKPVDPSDWSSQKKAIQDDESNTGWGSASTWGAKAKTNDASTWNSQKKDIQDSETNAGWDATPAWGKNQKPADSSDWNSQKKDIQDSESNAGWGSVGSWGAKAKTNDAPIWNSQKRDMQDSESNAGWDATATWGKKPKPVDSSNWNSQKRDIQDSESNAGWGSPATWGAKAKANDAPTWNSQKGDIQDSDSNADWGSAATWGEKAKTNDLPTWGSQKRGIQDSESKAGWDSTATWGTKPQAVDPSDWNSQKSDIQDSGNDGWGSLKESSPQAWKQPNCGDRNQDDNNPWASMDERSSNAWDQPNLGDSFKKNQSGGSRGWGKSGGDWGGKRNRPPKSPGVGSEFGTSALYTVTRQRLDMFTSEEQDILSEIEPVMLSIRRIMHQSGYNDGDPLSADDQSFILEKVFSYHPDKEAKSGSGVDYVTVNKHTSFQESRCFYIVSTDGAKQDFSYRKCLDNFVKEKFPELAEEFFEKYFRKPRSWGNRERKPSTPEATATPEGTANPEATGDENAQ